MQLLELDHKKVRKEESNKTNKILRTAFSVPFLSFLTRKCSGQE